VDYCGRPRNGLTCEYLYISSTIYYSLSSVAVCYETAALLPCGSGFGVWGLVRNFADTKRGEGSWTLASVRALHLPSVAVQIFQMEVKVPSLGLEFGVWSLEFGVWSLEFGVWSLEFRVRSLGKGLGAEV